MGRHQGERGVRMIGYIVICSVMGALTAGCIFLNVIASDERETNAELETRLAQHK